MKSAIRIGAVTYLNTKPLIHQLEQLAPEAELILDLPSRLADRLEQGELDVALIPLAPLKIRVPQEVSDEALKPLTMSRYSTPPPLPLHDQPR